VSTAAKVFVVLLVLFSVAFSMVTVTFVAQQGNWKQLALDFRAAYQAARVEATSVEALAKTREVQLQAQIGQLSAQIEALQTKLGEGEAALKGKDSELLQVKAERETALANAKRAGQLQVLEKNRADRLEKGNQALLDQTTELQKRNLDLARRVGDLTPKVAVLEEEVRALKEQRYALEQQLAAIQKGPKAIATPTPGASLVREVGPAAPPAVPIRGQILKVDGSVASISVGSADGVTEGMSFVIYRGADYLGKLRVTDVEPNRSGGDLTLVRGDIRPQDYVRDERSFGLQR